MPFTLPLVLPALLAALVAAIAPATAHGWALERQQRLTGAGGETISQADRAAFDQQTGDLWLLQQREAVDEYAGVNYQRTRYKIRLVRVSRTAGAQAYSRWTTTPERDAVSGGHYALPEHESGENYFATTRILPAGMAVDAALQRVYVAAGDRIIYYSFAPGDAGWHDLVGPGAPGADWGAAKLVPGALAVDPLTHEVHVADAGAVRPLWNLDGSPPWTLAGTPRVRAFGPDGTLVRSLSLCDGTAPAGCVFGQFEVSEFAGTAITGLHYRAGELSVLGTRVDEEFGPMIGQLATVDNLTGLPRSTVTSGVGTRPLSSFFGLMDFGGLSDGGAVAPAFSDDEGLPTRLMELDATGKVQRFLVGAGTSSAACRFVSPRLRLAVHHDPGDGRGDRLAVVEDDPLAEFGQVVRVLVIRRSGGAQNCNTPETPRTPQAPELTVTLTPGSMVPTGGGAAVPLPGGSVAHGDRVVLTTDRELELAASDPDNDGAPLGPSTRCRFDLPDGTAISLGPSACAGGEERVDPAALARPGRAAFDVTDDDGDRGLVEFSVVRGVLSDTGTVTPEPLAPNATVDANATLTARFGLGDSRGNIDTWELAFGDGETATGTWRDIGDALAHTYDEPGEYTATLRLRTPAGETADTTTSFRVGTEALLAARLAATPTPAVVNQPVTFALDGSEGTSWSLDFGDDRPAAEGADPASAGAVTHVYGATGTYRAELMVRRGSRAETAGVTVTVGLGAPITRAVTPGCTTPLGVPLGELGLGDPALCTADPCDIDVQELGLTKLPISRPTGCSGVDDVPVEAAAPPPRAGARPQITRRALTLGRDGRIAVQVRCTTGAGLCAGTVRLTTLAATGRPAKALGSATFRSLPVGRRLTVRVRPSAANARQLREARRTRVRARLTPRTPASGITRPASDTATMALTASASRGG